MNEGRIRGRAEECVGCRHGEVSDVRKAGLKSMLEFGSKPGMFEDS